MPKFSIITVTYNAEQTLERTLQSVASQTCLDYEHLIVDGASSDGTVALARQYQQKTAEGRVVIVSEPDHGLYDAMNKAIGLAKGDFLCFLNAGDKLHNADTLMLTAAAASQDTGVIYGYTDIVDSEGRFLHRRRLSPPARLTWRSFQSGMTVCHQAFYANRRIVQNYDLRYRFSADFDWCIRCMKEGERLGLKNTFVKATLCDYLSEGMTTQNHKASLMERFRIMARHYGLCTTIMQHAWFVIRAIR